ncbi:LuxR C-terminal-related transcriptional regulator [Marinobacteraceae bacterium S3BR75-40.1]
MLLATKFLRPAPDPRAIARERLTDQLGPRPGKRLTTVTAPAGYGKTTLVNQWVEQQTGQVLWLSLDENDDQPERFWEYVVGAFEQSGLVDESVRQRIHELDASSLEGALTTLINQLTQASAEATLVIDDYHFIQSPEIHRQLAFLVDYLPPGIQLVLISRTEPPLPLARWRVRQWLDDFHASDLAFSQQECHRFFVDYMGMPLSEEETTQIWQRTEGWAAAMQLAALSGRGQNASSAVMGYSGDSKHISDYVLGEILEQQQPEIQSFLLDTAICLRICASLCDQIREREDSQALLEHLVQANLFVIPLDVRGEWYRYHDLFREALVNRLKQSAPERWRLLQSRAVEWFIRHDQFQEAVELLVQLEDWPWLTQVLEGHGNTLIHGGFHLPVLSWLRHLPQEHIESNPRLLMLNIWALFFSNKLEVIEPLLERLEDLLDRRVADSHPDAGGALALHSEIALIRSYLARSRSDLRSANELTLQVLEDIDHSDIPLKSVTYYGIGLDSYGRGDIAAARSALQSAIEHGKLEKKHSTVLSSGGLLAWILFEQGEMDLALETASQVRNWVDSFHTDPTQPRLISCWQNSAMAEIYRERNDLETARTHLLPLLDHLEKGTEPGQHVVIQYVRAHLAFSEGDLDTAVEALEDAQRVLAHKQDAIPFEPPALNALWARCQLELGHVETALHWAENQTTDQYHNPINRERCIISAARVFVANDAPDKAIELLNPLRFSAEKDHHIKHLMEILAVYSLALHNQGRPEEASRMLRRSLELASRDRFLRLFIEEDPALLSIYRHVDRSTLPAAYVRELDKLLGLQSEGSQGRVVKRRIEVPELTEPLSIRELEVLKLINQGLANKLIAQKLEVAPTTIKAHIRNLYGKLGVTSRTEALAKARQLRLLDDESVI